MIPPHFQITSSHFIIDYWYYCKDGEQWGIIWLRISGEYKLVGEGRNSQGLTTITLGSWINTNETSFSAGIFSFAFFGKKIALNSEIMHCYLYMMILRGWNFECSLKMLALLSCYVSLIEEDPVIRKLTLNN